MGNLCCKCWGVALTQWWWWWGWGEGLLNPCWGLGYFGILFKARNPYPFSDHEKSSNLLPHFRLKSQSVHSCFHLRLEIKIRLSKRQKLEAHYRPARSKVGPHPTAQITHKAIKFTVYKVVPPLRNINLVNLWAYILIWGVLILYFQSLCNATESQD